VVMVMVAKEAMEEVVLRMVVSRMFGAIANGHSESHLQACTTM